MEDEASIELLRIGEAARRANIGIETTRYDEREALPADFLPHEGWKGPGRRWWSPATVRVQTGRVGIHATINTDHCPRANFPRSAIRQHWISDVTFGEDSRRRQDRNGSANPTTDWLSACCGRRRRTSAVQTTSGRNAPLHLPIRGKPSPPPDSDGPVRTLSWRLCNVHTPTLVNPTGSPSAVENPSAGSNRPVRCS